MRFAFNFGNDPVIKELVKFAGSEKICEQAMHNAADDPDAKFPMPIDLIIKHIKILKNT